MALTRQESTFGKVIVRTRDRRLFRGFSKSEFFDTDTVRIIDEKGQEQSFPVVELKAVFFVRDFTGNPEYREVRFFTKADPSPFLWVQLTYQDGEIMEGRVRNSATLLDGSGFFLWVSDEGANNLMVYVVKSALRDFRVLGLRT